MCSKVNNINDKYNMERASFNPVETYEPINCAFTLPTKCPHIIFFQLTTMFLVLTL